MLAYMLLEIITVHPTLRARRHAAMLGERRVEWTSHLFPFVQLQPYILLDAQPYGECFYYGLLHNSYDDLVSNAQ